MGDNPDEFEPYSFCNCGRKKNCPDMRKADGGIVIGESADELRALEEPRVGVFFDHEQARDLAEQLRKLGY